MVKKNVQNGGGGFMNMFSSNKIYDESVYRELDRNNKTFDKDFIDIQSFLFTLSNNPNISKYINGTDINRDRGEQYDGIRNLDKNNIDINRKKTEINNFNNLIDNYIERYKNENDNKKLKKIKKLVENYVNKTNTVNISPVVVQKQPAQQEQPVQQSVNLDASLLETIINKNNYKNIAIKDNYNNISDYLDVVIKLIETMNADTVNYKYDTDTGDLIKVYEFVKNVIVINNFTQKEQNIICEKMKKLEELKNVYEKIELDLKLNNINCQTQQGGKKRRTKCSKAPTAKRTRGKKCAKKAKRTAKKMRS